MSVPKKLPSAMHLARNKGGDLYFVQWQRGLGFITWHVDTAGAISLGNRGVGVGQSVSPALFADLKKKGFLYTGGGGSSGADDLGKAPHPSPPAPPPALLFARTTRESARKAPPDVDTPQIRWIVSEHE